MFNPITNVMTTISLSSTAIKNMFDQLQQNFSGNLSVKVKEHILDIDNEFGRGRIRGITFKSGISLLEFDVKFSQDFTLRAGTAENPPICFAYCLRGKVTHSFGNQSNKKLLENFQTGILTNKAFEENVLHFTKGEHIKISLIVVKTTSNQNILRKHNLNYRIQKSFLRGKESTNSIYIGSYNLKIADKIQQLEAIQQRGIVRSLMIEGLVHLILAYEIQQHTDDVKNKEMNKGNLTHRELGAVREISKTIQNFPETQHSISELSHQSGLSPGKLQEGFKLMHGTTVSDYIRVLRVEKAEELIKTSDLNISQVVYSVGFTSRSYFSKIFKQKYNCSPKEYKEKQQLMSLSA